MRARNIKPGFLENEYLAECEPLARLLFCGLWMMADREGRLEDRPKRIKRACLGYDECNVDDLLNQLAATPNGQGEPPFIVRYCVDGTGYIQITNFRKHQSPHPNEPKSEIPGPESVSSCESQNDMENHATCTQVTSNLQATCTQVTNQADSFFSDSLNQKLTVPNDADASISGLKIRVPIRGHPPVEITEKQIASWQAVYTAVDVTKTLEEIRLWNEANPAKQKTKSGILRHITGWLARAQNNGGGTFKRNVDSHKLTWAEREEAKEHDKARTRATH